MSIYEDWEVAGLAPSREARQRGGEERAPTGLRSMEHVCPDCRVERADYEGPGGKWLPTCPNCSSTADPVAAVPDLEPCADQGCPCCKATA